MSAEQSTIEPHAASEAPGPAAYGQSEAPVAPTMMEEPKAEDPTLGRKLFVGGLSWDTDDAAMSDYFAAFGEVEEAIVVYNRAACVSRGFGFVTFKSIEDAERCLCHANHKINDKSVEAKRAVQKGEQGRMVETMDQKMAKQVFIGGLPQNTTSDQLKEWAQEEWGVDKIANAIAVLDLETKVTRGFGFVNFTDPSMVAVAINATGGREYYIGEKKVEVKRAQIRDRMSTGGGSGGRGRGRGRGKGRSGRGHQNGHGYSHGGKGQFQGGFYGQQYGTPAGDPYGQTQYGGGQFDMAHFGNFMGYPQAAQAQAYGTPQQMQAALYSGMVGYGQQPPPAGTAPTIGKQQPKGVGMAAGMPQGAPLHAQGGAGAMEAGGMEAAMRSFEQMNIAASAPMAHMMPYSQPGAGGGVGQRVVPPPTGAEAEVHHFSQ